MSDEARKKLLEFYIGLRRQGYDDEEEPVPVTARQLEALIRLGEAKARTRLSDKITVEDAESVIEVVNYCLKHVFTEPETDKLDGDWRNAGTTKHRRARARPTKGIRTGREARGGGEGGTKNSVEPRREEGRGCAKE